MSVGYNGKTYKAKEKLKLQKLGIVNISDIEGLDKLVSLKYLDLDDNLITEINGLDNLKNLESLSLQNNKIEEVQGLENLLILENIFLYGNPVYDWLITKYGKKYRDNAQILVEYCYEKKDIPIIDEDYKLIRKVLRFEFANQKNITKVDIVNELNFTVNDLAKYFKIINQKISYSKEEKPDLLKHAERVLKAFPSPTLYDLMIFFKLNYTTAVKLGQYLINVSRISEFPNFPLKEKRLLYEDYELVKKVLKFEFDNQRKITKAEMVHVLHFSIDDVDKYLKIVNQKISYKKGEKQDLEYYAEEAMKLFPSPTLYDLMIFFKLYYEKAVKVGQYLIDEGWKSNFPDFPSKDTKRAEKDALEKIKQMVKVSDRIKLDMMRSALKLDEVLFNEKIFEWADKFDFRIDADILIINQEKLSEFMDALEEEVAVFREQKICLVCRGRIAGFNNFICPKCDALYCDKCARALSNMENICWVCESPLDITKPVQKEQLELEKIEIKEKFDKKEPKK